MAGWALPIVALALANAYAANAATPASILPPNHQLWSLDEIKEVGESPMWDAPLNGSIARYRLTLIGIACKRHVVRLDERTDGSVNGDIKVWNHCRRHEPYLSRNFRLRSSQFGPIKAAMQKAQLWQRDFSYWVIKDDNDLCIDGVEVTFERRDRRDFRVDQANVWCTPIYDYIVAAKLLLTAVGDREGLSLLPEVAN